jgi:hypothetical protein
LSTGQSLRCAVHLGQHAADCDATRILEEKQEWITAFAANAKLKSLEAHQEHWHYTATHPDVEHMALGVVRNGKRGKKPTKTQVFAAIFDYYAANLLSDLGTADYPHAQVSDGTSYWRTGDYHWTH